ncbi:MAG: hypothetical protein IJ521_06235 [Schwartzia sp.]|nr:hypothetical protein [Schwartzia sp. (in: firmicutes)]
MAKIIIHKGYISHGGRLYKAGEVVTIADAAYAKRIVARSGGDFDFYHGGDIPATKDAPTDEQPTAAENEGNVSESDNEADGAGGELPAIDADADVQTARPTKGKKR